MWKSFLYLTVSPFTTSVVKRDDALGVATIWENFCKIFEMVLLGSSELGERWFMKKPEVKNPVKPSLFIFLVFHIILCLSFHSFVMPSFIFLFFLECSHYFTSFIIMFSCFLYILINIGFLSFLSQLIHCIFLLH